jgi:hypothetical protein
MHAVVVNTRVEESAMDPEYKILREQIIPAVRQLPGFVGGYWLAPVTGIGLSVVFFESEDVARKNAETMGVKPGGSLSPGTSFESVEFVEVAGHA